MIFKGLAGKPAVYVNLDAWYCRWALKNYGQLPLTSPVYERPTECARMVEDCCAHYDVEWTFGGYMEHRGNVLAGSYLAPEKKFIHLGVDLNVRAGTGVYADRRLKVIGVERDPSKGGWGTRLMARVVGFGLTAIYAHIRLLKPYAVGDIIDVNERFAVADGSATNGDWYPHVHVQVLTGEGEEYYLKHPDQLDGYCSPCDLVRVQRLHADPLIEKVILL